MSATLTINLDDIKRLEMDEDLLAFIRNEVKNAVQREVDNLRPVISEQIKTAMHQESIEIIRSVVKSDEMQESCRQLALGIGAAAVKKHIERITEELFADVRRVKEGL